MTNEEMMAIVRPHLDAGDGGYLCDLGEEHVIAACNALLAARPSGYTAVDMTTAAAQGFRDGQAAACAKPTESGTSTPTCCGSCPGGCIIGARP